MMSVRAVEPIAKGTRRHVHSVRMQWGSRHALEEAVQSDNSRRTCQKGTHWAVQGVKYDLLRWRVTNALVLVTQAS